MYGNLNMATLRLPQFSAFCKNIRFVLIHNCSFHHSMNSSLCAVIDKRLFSSRKVCRFICFPSSRTIVRSSSSSSKNKHVSFKQERQNVLLVSETGASLGEKSFVKAKDIAKNESMELVWVNKDMKTSMPVYKMMRKLDLQQRGSNSKAGKSKTVEVSDKIESRDLAFKLKQIQKLLEKGHQVRICLKSKGNSEGDKWNMLKKIEQELEEIAVVVGKPREDNPRQIICTFNPKQVM